MTTARGIWCIAVVILCFANSALAQDRAGILVSGTVQRHVPSEAVIEAYGSQGVTIMPDGDMRAALAFFTRKSAGAWTEAELHRLKEAASLTYVITIDTRRGDGGDVVARALLTKEGGTIVEFSTFQQISAQTEIDALLTKLLVRLKPALVAAQADPSPTTTVLPVIPAVAPGPTTPDTAAPVANSGTQAIQPAATQAESQTAASSTSSISNSELAPSPSADVEVSGSASDSVEDSNWKMMAWDAHLVLGEGADTFGTGGIGVGLRWRLPYPQSHLVIEGNATSVFAVEGASVTQLGVPVLYGYEIQKKKFRILIEGGAELKISSVSVDGQDDSTGHGIFSIVAGVQVYFERYHVSAREYLGDGDSNFLLGFGYGF